MSDGGLQGGADRGSDQGSDQGSDGALVRVPVRVCLPYHLRNLAQVGPEIAIEVARPVTIGGVLDAVEAQYPMLRGTIRDHTTKQRRPFLRFFACQEDLSHQGMDAALPAAVEQGSEPLLVIGAIAGG